MRRHHMKSVLIICIALLFAGPSRGDENSPSLADVNGSMHTPLSFGGRKAVVLVFVSPFCPISNAFTPEVNRMAEKYADQFAFYFVEADAGIKIDDAKKHAEMFEMKPPLLLDPKQQLVKLTKAKTTPEAVVLSAKGDILYQGRINDLYATQTKKLKEPTTHDLRVALDAIAAGRPVTTPLTKAIGCSITAIP
jgi:hypothetical protein